jgi:mono/diheme cytochrome c family protein
LIAGFAVGRGRALELPYMRCWLLAAALIAATGLAAIGEDAPSLDAPTFDAVQAIFAAKCLACHGNEPKELRGEYAMRSRASALKGGESGDAAIVPGDSEKSPLYRAVTWEDESLQMPPKENDRLSKEQVAVVRRWIEAGAMWEVPASAPSKGDRAQSDHWNAGAGGVRIATSGGLSADWNNRTYEAEAVWAYQPVRRVELPGARGLGLGMRQGILSTLSCYRRFREKASLILRRGPTTVRWRGGWPLI